MTALSLMAIDPFALLGPLKISPALADHWGLAHPSPEVFSCPASNGGCPTLRAGFAGWAPRTSIRCSSVTSRQYIRLVESFRAHATEALLRLRISGGWPRSASGV